MGRLLAANASSAASNLETVVGITSPAINNGRRRVYLHDITVAPRAANFIADVQLYLCKGFTGTEMVTNGAFAADTDWTKGAGWTIAAGKATKVVAGLTALEQALTTPVVGDIYKLSYGLTETAAGITPSFAGDSAPADAGTGTHVPILVAASTTAALAFTADATAQVDVDNVSVIKYGSNVDYFIHDTIRAATTAQYVRTFHNKQPYSTSGWSLYATAGGAACILDIVITYEIV